MPIAVIAFDFDPYLHFGDRAITWQTLALAGAIFALIALAALVAGRTPSSDGDSAEAAAHLRRDDLLFIALGVVPGAIIGGRIGYVLIHSDYYRAHPAAIIDPGQGSLQLSVALVVGALTGAYVAQMLEGPVGRWLHVAVVPVLVGLTLGKISMALGGSGQGAPWEGQPATAYLGPGPWGSIDPATPAYPSQLIEAGLTLVVLVVTSLLLWSGRFRSRDGRAFLVAVALWAVARFAVAFTWRDPVVLGPLGADQLISLAILAGCIVLFARRSRRPGHVDVVVAEAEEVVAETEDRSGLDWPELSDRRYLRPRAGVSREDAPRPPTGP